MISQSGVHSTATGKGWLAGAVLAFVAVLGTSATAESVSTAGTWSKEQRISAPGKGPSFWASSPVAAANEQGVAVVLWAQRLEGSSCGRRSVMMAVRPGKRAKWSKPRYVETRPALRVFRGCGSTEVKALTDGRFIASWQRGGSQVYAIGDRLGRGWTPARVLPGTASGVQAVITPGLDGSASVLYEGARTGKSRAELRSFPLRAATLNPKAKQLSGFQNLGRTVSPLPDISQGSDGSLSVAFGEDRAFDTQRVAVRSARTMRWSVFAPPPGSAQRGVRVAAKIGGGAVAAWVDGSAFVSAYRPETGWGAPAAVPAGSPPISFDYVDVLAAGEDVLVATCIESGRRLQVSILQQDGSWRSPVSTGASCLNTRLQQLGTELLIGVSGFGSYEPEHGSLSASVVDLATGAVIPSSVARLLPGGKGLSSYTVASASANDGIWMVTRTSRTSSPAVYSSEHALSAATKTWTTRRICACSVGSADSWKDGAVAVLVRHNTLYVKAR